MILLHGVSIKKLESTRMKNLTAAEFVEVIVLFSFVLGVTVAFCPLQCLQGCWHIVPFFSINCPLCLFLLLCKDEDNSI